VTVSKPVVVTRLTHLGNVIRDLERLRALPRIARETDAIANLALERALQIAAEAVFDIGHHILAGRGLDVPATYREVLPALARAGVIDTALLARLEGLAGLRNILVHDYVVVESPRLWQLLDERHEDLQAIHTAFAAIPEIQ
jgi:uncharacterized protein YutE (UPF0331/DUF86 family)